MKIEKVQNDKIKVTLTPADLVLYDIECDNLRPDSPNLHKFLFDIMENVKEETGFNPYSGQVMVEAQRDESGISLIISKININQAPHKIPKSIKAVKAKPRIKQIKYIFKSFDDLCSALKLVQFESISSGALYKYDNRWYLLNKFSQKTDLILREFCFEARETKSADTFLREHASLIAEGGELVKMAKGIKALD